MTAREASTRTVKAIRATAHQELDEINFFHTNAQMVDARVRGDDVGGDLTPVGGDFNARLGEHDRPVRISNLALGFTECDVRVGGLVSLCVAPFDPHIIPQNAAGIRPA